MKVVVLGTRGIPGIQGGVETHCAELYPRLAAMGHDVTVICRTPYLRDDHPQQWRGVRLLPLRAPRRKALEAIVHTWRGIMAARRLHPDVLHIHAIGPSLLVPLARLMGMRVVTTNHGPDYDRQKWGRMAKAVLRLGERLGARFSNSVIVISPTIQGILADKYGRRDTELIYNGIPAVNATPGTDYLDTLGLAPGRYILALGRLVEEKGFHDLIDAYRLLQRHDIRLVIAGAADHEDAYSQRLKQLAADTPGVVMPGFVSGNPLQQLLAHARLFAMPSYHEGLPIALLEAMAYRRPVAVSDIPACRLPQLPPACTFPVGDSAALATLLRHTLDTALTEVVYDLTPYNWDTIAQQTVRVYERVTKKNLHNQK